MTERNRKRVGVSKALWKKLGPAGQVACSRMWDELSTDFGNWLHPDTPKMKRQHWSTLRCNMAIAAGFVVKEMKIDEKAGIALWDKGVKPPWKK